MSRLSDTSPEAQRAQLEALRRMTPGEKWLRIGEHWNEARRQHAAEERSKNPAVTEMQIHEAWLRKVLGESLADEVMQSKQYANWLERARKDFVFG